MEVNFVNALILIGLSILAVIFGVLPIEANETVLKLTLLVPMFALSIAYGLLPNMLHHFVCDIKNPKLKSISALVCSLFTCFAGGVILGLCILDLMPTAKHDFRFVEKQSGWITRYPFVELFIGLGLLLMFLIDELVKRAFKDEDEFYIESQATSLVRRMSTDPHFQKHGSVLMFEALRQATMKYDMNQQPMRNRTMTTFKVFSPKKAPIKSSKMKHFDINFNSMKENGFHQDHPVAHRTKTCPNKIVDKHHEPVHKTNSNKFVGQQIDISTPEINMRRKILLKNHHEKSHSIDNGEVLEKRMSVKFEDDKELPILNEILHEKAVMDSFKKARRSTIKFSLDTDENYVNFQQEDEMEATQTPNSVFYESTSESVESPKRKYTQNKRISVVYDTDNGLGHSRSPLVKMLSSRNILKRISFKQNPLKFRAPTIESVDMEGETPNSIYPSTTSTYAPATPTPTEMEAGTPASVKSVMSDRPEIPSDTSNSCLQVLLVISVFFFHAFLEGFAFGIQDSSINIMSLFFAIMVHKSLVMYSAGLNLKARFGGSKLKLLGFIGILALITPLGGIVGFIVESAKFNQIAKAALTTVLHCFSIAMFLFLAIFEIIAEERVNRHSNLIQWLGYAAGFITIALILVAKDFTHEMEKH